MSLRRFLRHSERRAAGTNYHRAAADSAGAPQPPPSAARWSRPCATPPTATRSARMPAAIRSTARWRSRPGRSPPTTSPTSPTPRRPSASARIRNGRRRARSSRSTRGGTSSARRSASHLARGYDIRPTIAVTRAHIDMPEIRAAIAAGRIRADGSIVSPQRQRAGHEGRDRSGLVPARHRRALRHRARPSCGAACSSRPAACIPSWSTRPDLKVFLPPIGGTTVYCFGDPAKLGDGKTPLACRVHDECNGSDVFGSDICTCRPYLAHGIEICIEMAQAGRRRPRGLQPQGRPRARRGDQVPGLQRAQAPGGRRPPGQPTSSAPNASPACRTCASRS